jgi:hypothetical protein
MTTLADDLAPDQLWALVAPLLPAPPRPPYGGRHRTISDRACLAAIVYMARTSTPWRLLPARELGCGSPATCWRRLTEWTTCHRSVHRRGGGAPDPPRSTPTKAMTAEPTGPTCAGVESPCGSLGVGSSGRRGLGGTAGGWSGRCRG